MLIKEFAVGQLQTNCYVVTDEATLACAVIDPGAESGTILNYLEEYGLKAEAVFITHGHFDHTTAARALTETTGAKLFIHPLDAAADRHSPMKYTIPPGTIYYTEGSEINICNLCFRILETPGHSPGSVTIMCEDALFTGDALFAGSCGRTDLEGGNMDVLLASLKRLGNLEGDFEVYPGHGPATSLDRERLDNFYLRQAMERE